MIKTWWKTLSIIDVSNIYQTYAKYKNIYSFEDYFDFLKTIINKLTTNSKKTSKKNFFMFLWVDKKLKESVKFKQNCIQLLWKENVITKNVKYFKHKWKTKRKADLDADIWYYIWKLKDQFTSFMIFSSDWDFAWIYEELLEKWKQVIVLHWYIEEKIIQKWTRKSKIKKNLWKEVFELYKKYKSKIITKWVDKIFE